LSNSHTKSSSITSSFEGTNCIITLGGHWKIGSIVKDTNLVLNALASYKYSHLQFKTTDLGDWDSSLLVCIIKIIKIAESNNVIIAYDELPEGVNKLIKLAFFVPTNKDAEKKIIKYGFFRSIYETVAVIPKQIEAALYFIGEVSISLFRLFRGRADVRFKDILECIQECSVQSLPIVSITSLLFGLILAFMGAIQLSQFGAQIYVAGLVGISMLRIMGAIMVGIVMSGRMGASFAAMIGTMQVNEEIDALETLSISPIDFLVLPRFIALVIMVPLLTLYADFMGLLGGFLVGVFMLGMHPIEYYNATIQMVAFKHVIIGLIYGTVFGIIIAMTGCYEGIRCGRSAAAVGIATTSAVVSSIVLIIIATSIITIIFNILNI